MTATVEQLAGRREWRRYVHLSPALPFSLPFSLSPLSSSFHCARPSPFSLSIRPPPVLFLCSFAKVPSAASPFAPCSTRRRAGRGGARGKRGVRSALLFSRPRPRQSSRPVFVPCFRQSIAPVHRTCRYLRQRDNPGLCAVALAAAAAAAVVVVVRNRQWRA